MQSFFFPAGAEAVPRKRKRILSENAFGGQFRFRPACSDRYGRTDTLPSAKLLPNGVFPALRRAAVLSGIGQGCWTAGYYAKNRKIMRGFDKIDTILNDTYLILYDIYPGSGTNPIWI